MPIVFIQNIPIYFSHLLVKAPGKLNWAGQLTSHLLNPYIRKMKESAQDFYTITYLPGFSCNLSCKYCFQLNEEGHRPSGLDKLDDEKVDNLIKIIQQKGYSDCNLILLGGEPLIYINQIKALFNRISACLNIHTTIITNGTLLNNTSISFLKAINCKTVQVSIDGGQKGQSFFRNYKNNHNSYEDVINGIETLLNQGFSVNLRVNIFDPDEQNIYDLIEDVNQFSNKDSLRISFVPVDDTLSFKNKQQDMSTLALRIKDFYKHSARRNIRCTSPTNHRGCKICDIEPGEELNHGIVLGPNSKLYSCWDTAGFPGFEIGNLSEGLTHNCTSSRWQKCGNHSHFTTSYWDHLESVFRSGVEEGSYEKP